MKRFFWNLFIFSVLGTALLSGCRGGQPTEHKEGNIEIARFEKVLFDTPVDQMRERLTDFRNQYSSPLLNIYPDNADFMAQLQGFIADSIMQRIYTISQQHYDNLSWLEEELTKALKKAAKEDADISMEHFATFVSGFFDYSQRILADRDSKSLLVSIDQYAVGHMEQYNYFGLPMFIVTLSDSAYLASDIMGEIARQYIASPEESQITMLDRMVMEGKVLYFLDVVMPKKADHLKIRYTPEQLEWCQRNEGMIWAYFIQHNLLYEKDFNRYHNFVDDAPKTNAFKDSSPRTTDYIGWQIVRNYMKNNKCSMKELFENTNSQSILQASQYKP